MYDIFIKYIFNKLRNNMKKLLTILFFVTSSMSAYANTCKDTYHAKGVKRDNLNSVALVVAGTTISAVAGAGAILLMGPAVISGAVASVGTQVGVYSLYAVSVGSLSLPTININNKFEKIENTIIAAEAGNTNHRDFQKLIKKIRRASVKEGCERINNLNDLALNTEVSDFIVRSNDNGALCPTVVTKKGKEKTALFGVRSLANFYVGANCQ
jgi:hypothetical protein